MNPQQAVLETATLPIELLAFLEKFNPILYDTIEYLDLDFAGVGNDPTFQALQACANPSQLPSGLFSS